VRWISLPFSCRTCAGIPILRNRLSLKYEGSPSYDTNHEISWLQCITEDEIDLLRYFEIEPCFGMTWLFRNNRHISKQDFFRTEKCSDRRAFKKWSPTHFSRPKSVTESPHQSADASKGLFSRLLKRNGPNLIILSLRLLGNALTHPKDRILSDVPIRHQYRRMDDSPGLPPSSSLGEDPPAASLAARSEPQLK
jgi:hypothetical protein